MILPGLPFGLAGRKKPIEFVAGTGIAVTANGTVLNLPSGMLPGDLVLVMTYFDGTAPAVPTGYTSGQSGSGLRWSYKIMPDPVDTQAVGLSSGGFATHSALVFRNVNKDNPLAATPPAGSLSFSTTPDPPAITPEVDGSMIVVICGLFTPPSLVGVTPPSGYTFGASSRDSTSNESGVISAYKADAPGGVSENPGAFGIVEPNSVPTTLALRPK